jgi:sulfide:quinone oxidoreductase
MSLPRIVILGAGLGGTIAAYEIRDATKGRAEVTVVSDSEDYWFVPSNPWVAVRWRQADAIRVHLPPVMRRKGIGFTSVGCARVHPTENRLDLADGSSLTYDYLVIATGPDLAFDEVSGLGPDGHTVSVCRTDHATHAADLFDAFCQDPRPIVVGAAQGPPALARPMNSR